MGDEGGYITGFLIFYIVFFLIIALIGGMGGPSLTGGEINPPPSLSDYQGSLTLSDYLGFVFNIIIYFIGLQGLTLLGIGASYAVLISLPLNIGMVYCIARLVRGGG